MGSVALAFRAWLRQRWRAAVGLALLLGLIGGVALTAAAGARRTATAYPRLLRWSHAAHVLVVPRCVGLGPFYAALGRLPQVASRSAEVVYELAVPGRGGLPAGQLEAAASPDGALGRTTDRVRILAGRRPPPGDPAAVVAFDDQVVPAPGLGGAPRVLLSPGFWRSGTGRRFGPGDAADVRLRPGASLASFTAAARALARHYPSAGALSFTNQAGQVAATEQAIRPEAISLAVAGSVTGSIGVRMAFEPGHGRSAVPVRSSLAVTAVALASLLASLVFGASLITLIDTPHWYGQN